MMKWEIVIGLVTALIVWEVGWFIITSEFRFGELFTRAWFFGGGAIMYGWLDLRERQGKL